MSHIPGLASINISNRDVIEIEIEQGTYEDLARKGAKGKVRCLLMEMEIGNESSSKLLEDAKSSSVAN